MKAIVLTGGNGTRLFPVSRKSLPKQFLKLGFDESLFQKTVKRNLLFVEEEDLVIVTNRAYKFILREQLQSILGRERSRSFRNIVLEPETKNTAPAIALAVKFCIDELKVPEDEVLFISPSDHIISPEDRFVDYVKKAEKLAKEGYIVTFGIRPTKPETGYGYIESLEKSVSRSIGAFKVKRFHEKPDLKTAIEYLSSGNFFWNSGMFAFTVATILEEFEKHTPEIFEKIIDMNYRELINKFYSLPEISIDYAVMEKTDKAVVLPLNVTWSDMGSWESYYDVLDKDKKGNVKIGNVLEVDTKNSLIIGNKRLISTVGIENLIIVETDDVVLVAKKGEGQKVKEIVKKLKEDENLRKLTEFHTKVYRPWGSYTELERGYRYKVKKLVVNPGEALSLQLHYHRSEHWIVVKGTAKVTLVDENGKKELLIKENESIYVPKGMKHKLSNPGKIPLEVIEVQVGEYLEEDDIERFDVNYEEL